MGRGEDRERTAGQARHQSLAAHGAQVHAKEARLRTSRRSALAHVSAQSRSGHRRLRFLCCGHGQLSRSIHLCDHRARLTPSSPLECDLESDGSLREAIASDHPYRLLVHDRDSIYTQALDTSIANLRLRVLKTPYRSPKANSLCERLIGSLRRECLDWAIPLSEGHLRSLLKMWSTYYNRERPHMALGPAVPDPPRGVPAPLRRHRHRLSASRAVVAKPVLNGLHHDYRLAPCSA